MEKNKIEEIEKLLGLPGCRVDRINCLNRKFYHIYTVTIEIHKSRKLIGTVEIAKFVPV